MCGVVICTKPWLWWMLWLGSEWTGSLIVFCMRDHHLELKTAASLLPLVCVYVQRNYCRKGPNLLTLPARDSWWLSYPHRKSSGCWHLVRDPGMLQFLARTWCSRRRRSSSPGACTACSWQRKHTWCYVIQGCCLSPCHHVQAGSLLIERRSRWFLVLRECWLRRLWGRRWGFRHSVRWDVCVCKRSRTSATTILRLSLS